MSGAPTLQTLHDRLLVSPERDALGLRGEFGARWWTYRRLHAEALKAAAVLAGGGVGKGDRVLLVGGNSPEWVAFLLGAALRGAVVVPLDPDPSPESAERVSRAVGARLMVAAAGAADRVPPDPSLPRIAMDVLHRPPAIPGPGGAAPAPVAVGPDDPAVIFHTSGTTDEARGVVLTHGNLMAQVARFRRWRGLTRLVSFRMLVVAPLSHAQGLMLGACIPLSLGLAVLFVRWSAPGHLIRAIRDNRITLLSTVPRSLSGLTGAVLDQPVGPGGETLRERLARSRSRMVARHFRFTTIRRLVGYRFWVVLVGGAPLPPATERFWRRSGCFLVQGYGLTETAAVVSVTSPLFGGVGSVGRPLSHQDVRIAEDGEILVRGPNVSPAYGGNGEPAGPGGDGYLRTGDLGRLDRRRRLHLVGRKKEVIVTGEGFNVLPATVEAALGACRGVRDSVVLGVEREGHTHVHAVLLLEEGAHAGEVVRRANEALPAPERVAGWTVWGDADFPRNALEKVRRRAVEERLGEWREGGATAGLPDPAPVTVEAVREAGDPAEQLELAARYVLRADPPDALARRTALVGDLGLGSLAVVELLSLVERRSGVVLDNVVVREEATLADLADAVRRRPLPGEGGVRSGDVRQPPRWAESPVLQPLRRVLHPLVLGGLVRARVRMRVEGLEHLEGLEPPLVLAGMGHEHAFDVLLIRQALPRRLRRKPAAVASRWVFGFYLDPDVDAPRHRRWLVAAGFHLLAPLFMPFALTPRFGTTREGLAHAGRLVDRGFSPIVFEGPGSAVVARECGVPLVPVFLAGNEGVGFVPGRRRAEVEVRFGPPLATTPDVDGGSLIRALEDLVPE